MDNYKYSLQKYSGRDSRHTCPACGRPHCFTLYVDAAGNPLASDVGRCEHLSKCGYHKTPAQYFAENPQERERKEYHPALPQHPKKDDKVDFIPYPLIQRSESMENNLMRYLGKYFPADDLKRVTQAYHLGSTSKGEIIYTQLDVQGRCRTGKIIDYDKDGHRVRPEWGEVDWIHRRYMKMQGKKKDDFHFVQCLFGEHLLPARPNDMVCLTEGEKTAVICSMVFPQFVWVSCGGQGMLTAERCKPLANRDVIVYADANAVGEWGEKIKSFTFCRSIHLSDWAKDEPQGSKRDIADLIMNERKPLDKPTTIGDILRWNQELGFPKERFTINI